MKSTTAFAAFLLMMASTAAGQPPAAFSTAINGSSVDQAWSVTTDAAGNSWIAGLTYSSDFPCGGGYMGGLTDAFAARFDANGNVVWCTTLGGSTSDGTISDQMPAIAHDSTGAVWVTGSTWSTDFPVTSGGSACGANADIFVVKLGTTGNVLFSGCYGSAYGDGGTSVAVDAADHAWITGFVDTGSGRDAVLFELDAAGTLQRWQSFGGALNQDVGKAVAIASSGAVYVSGYTNATDFPTTDGSACAVDGLGACYDGFLRAYVAGPSGTLSLIFSKVFGTAAGREDARTLSVDSGSNVYVGVQDERPYDEHASVVSFTTSGELRYATPFSADGRDWIMGVAANARGDAWVSGWSTSSALFPTRPPWPNRFGFLTRLDRSGAAAWCTIRMAEQPESAAAGPSDTIYLAGIADGAWLARVADDGPPDLSVTLSPSVLDNVNHKLQEITASVTVSDYCDPEPRVVLQSIVSSEPDNGTGDGDTANDIQDAAIGTDDRVFKLRAERAGAGTGRVYTVTYRAYDASGRFTDASRTVIVREK